MTITRFAGAFSAGLAALAVFIMPSVTHASADLWTDIDDSILDFPSDSRPVSPRQHRTLQLNTELFRARLENVSEQTPAGKGVLVALPLPAGHFVYLEAEAAPVMEPGLAARYPQMRTYRGRGLDGASVSARFGFTHKGFHATVFQGGETIYIDPYSRNSTDYYVSYRKRDVSDDEGGFQCLVESGTHPTAHEASSASRVPVSGQKLRTYRLALAANYEYTSYHSEGAPRRADALAAMVVTMNRVNAIYERDVAVNMVLVDNTESIIFVNPDDPYTNNSATQMVSVNSQVLNSRIGQGNYDIGHVLSTGGGGFAGIAVVCENGSAGRHKANGVTGRSRPEGDPFDIDYVAHEIGHQFGAYHTFNGTAANCKDSNRDPLSAYEVGSGSTIMGYAGICGGQNLQPNSDDLFHLTSITEITSFTAGIGNSCAAKTTPGNNLPYVDAGPDVAIPRLTPFELTATGSDPDGDELLYAWEQFDLGPASPGTSDDGEGPLFRAFNVTPEPTRVLPRNANIPGGPFPYGETLPSTSRTLTFRVTARDSRPGAGGVAWDEKIISVVSNAEFDVTYPDGGEAWNAGSTETVRWVKTRTDRSPISTNYVDVLLSTDGGLSYVPLASRVPNDGVQAVTVPAIATDEAVIKVAAVGNVYFDISSATFSINSGASVDSDGDGIEDGLDNCIAVPNPSQCDADGDGYGNRCDADLNNDGTVNFLDLQKFSAKFGEVGVNEADLDCSGVVNYFDLEIMVEGFGQAPGPSGSAP